MASRDKWEMHLAAIDADVKRRDRTEAVIAAARAATLEWDALRAKMTREPFMPRATREAFDTLSAAVAELDRVKP